MYVSQWGSLAAVCSLQKAVFFILQVTREFVSVLQITREYVSGTASRTLVSEHVMKSKVCDKIFVTIEPGCTRAVHS